MDNNYKEQAIRPFTIGHKNFVLIETSNGARASAMIYSIVETAKALLWYSQLRTYLVMLYCAHQVVTSIPFGWFWQSLICAAH